MHFTLFEIITGNGFDLTIFGIAIKHHRTRALFHIGYWPMGWDFDKRPMFQSLSILFLRINKKPRHGSYISHRHTK